MDVSTSELANAFYKILVAILSLKLYIILVLLIVIFALCFSPEIYEWCKYAYKSCAYKIARRRIPLEVVCDEIMDALYTSNKTRSLAQITNDIKLAEKKVWKALLLLIDNGYVTVHDNFYGPALDHYTLNRKAQLYFMLTHKIYQKINYRVLEFEVQPVSVKSENIAN